MGIHAMRICLLAPHVPGGLGATIAAPPCHGCSQQPAPGGAVPAPRGGRQCWAACAMRVGPATQMDPLYGVWAARGGQHWGRAAGPQWLEWLEPVLSPALSHPAGGNAGPGRAATHPLGHQGTAATGAGAGRGGAGIQALPPRTWQPPTGRQGELATVSPAWGQGPIHLLPLPQGGW